MSANNSTTTDSAIILFAHGSTVSAANQAVERLAAQLSARTGSPVVAAFLEKAQPDLATAVATLVGVRVKRVIIVPYFLTMGSHISRDLPELARREQQRFVDLRFEIAAPMEGHPLLLDVLLDRMTSAAKLGAPATEPAKLKE
jgi:sirohydrochlorin ferrochelatase